MHIYIQTKVIALIDYNLQAKGIRANDKHSAIVEFHSSNSYVETETFAHMAYTLEDMARRFEEQS